MLKLAFVLLLLVSFSPASAQDDTLPVLQPADVLAEGVTVVETLPQVNYDNSTNTLYFLPPDGEAWEGIPPPEELMELSDYVVTDRLPNGNFELSVAPSEMTGPCPPTTPAFEFDPAARTFTRHEPAPADLSPYWMVAYDTSAEDVRLVNNCDLTLVGADLPDDIRERIVSNTQNGLPFPDLINTSGYLVVGALSPDEGTYQFAIYTIAEDHWSESFPFPQSGEWGFTDIAFDDGLLYMAALGEAGSVYFSLDTATTTFTELFRTPYPQAVHRNQDSVFHYVGYDDTHYQFYAYDLFAQRGEVLAEIPCADLTGGCIELSIRDGNRGTNNPNQILVLRERETDEPSEEGVQFFVVDVTRAEVLYTLSFDPSRIISLSWLDQHRSGVIFRVYQNRSTAEAILVDLSADDPAGTQVTLPYQVGALSPDERTAIVYPTAQGARTRTIGLLDLETLAYRPITLPLNSGVLDARVSWRTDGTLELTVRSATDDFNRFYEPITLRTWIVEG